MSCGQDGESGIISFLMGMGIGAAAGAIGALLYAPEAGPHTRRRVAQAAKELRGRAEELAQRVRTVTHDVAERMKQDVETAVTAGKEAAAARRAELERELSGE